MSKAKRSRPRRPTRREVLEALAGELGPITGVRPAGRRSDGGPELGSGQVFVTKYGRLFHQGWCAPVGAYWDQHGYLTVTTLDLVGTRTACAECCVV